MPTLQQMTDQRQAKRDRMASIVALAKAESRELTPDESSEFDGLEAQTKELAKQVAEVQSSGRAAFLAGLETGEQKPSDFYLRPADSLYQHLRGTFTDSEKNLSVGKIVKGYVTGDWSGAGRERMAMQETPSSTGILLPAPIAANIIDIARAQAKVLTAGARVVPMSTLTLKYGRQISDVQSNWTPESTNIPPSGLAFDSILFTAKKLACLVPVSNELLADVDQMDRLIESSIGHSMALALDYAGLFGSGVAPVPQGLHGVVPTLPAGGVPTYDLILEAQEQVQAFNFDPNAVIFSSRTAGSLTRQKDSQGRYLEPPAAYNELTKLISNQVPNTQGTGTNQSSAFVGQWDQFALGLRASLQLEVTRDGAYFDGTTVQAAFSRDETVLRAILRADWQLLHQNAFVEVTGITAS